MHLFVCMISGRNDIPPSGTNIIFVTFLTSLISLHINWLFLSTPTSARHYNTYIVDTSPSLIFYRDPGSKIVIC